MALLTAGYFPTTYWPESYFNDDYWPEYGTGGVPPLAGTLLTAGYWPTTYWPMSYWADDYWPEAQVVAPPLAGTLLAPGYWPSTYFPMSMWTDDYWPDFGAVAVTDADSGGPERFAMQRGERQRSLIRRKRDDDDIFDLIKIINESGLLE